AESDVITGGDLMNFARINVLDALKRVEGVGDASVFGLNEFAMVVNLDVDKMAALGLTPDDVISALKSQNVQAAIGRVGGQPVVEDPGLQLNITTKGRLETTEEFAQVIVRSSDDGGIVRVGDVADVVLGERSSDIVTSFNGNPSTLIGIYLAPGGNAIAAADGAKAVMERIAPSLPAGMAFAVVSDSSVFVKESISAVEHTLFEAFVLVVIVVFIFLGSLRATIIPLVAVPVALVGTFA
ncbi:MAG: efflux RND transporter permease subunit, partial [Hyphomicrobiales bacterium]|nr:efflux RND transporter permease subunit [Hyphomicrobiales bacterium]